MDELRVTPPRCRDTTVNSPGAGYGPRRLYDHELVWMLQGRATYHADGKTWAVPADAMVLCQPADSDRWEWDPQGMSRHMYVHFDIKETPSDWPARPAWPRVLPAAGAGVAGPMLRHLLECGPLSPAVHQQQVLAVLVRTIVLGLQGLDQRRGPTASEPVQRALDLIESVQISPSRQLSLQDLAHAALVTPEHLCRRFSKELGTTPMQAVQHARLDRAMAMLTRSNAAVSSVAEQCGFVNAFHFSRVFKKTYGQSPRDVRRAVASGASPPVSRYNVMRRD